MTAGPVMAADVDRQVPAWVAALDVLSGRADELRHRWKQLDPTRIHVAGCGSVNYLSQTLAPLLQTATGVTATAGPGSALLDAAHYPLLEPAGSVLVAVSRSGETSEMVRAVEGFRAREGRAVWLLTTRSASTLAGLADLVLACDEGFETSVVQTRSFAALLTLGQGLCDVLADRPLPLPAAVAGAGAATLHAGRSLVSGLDMARFHRVIVLATNPLLGLAREGRLLLSEVALTDSAAHPFLDFRHGPIAMVDDATLVVALADPTTSAAELAVLDDVVAAGGTTLTLALGPAAAGPVGERSGLHLDVDPGDTGQLTLFLPPLQLIALRRAAATGVDPDRPRHLTAVVTLDGDR